MITSKWMEGTGPESDVVISSRVRLARNLKDFPFPSLASDSQRKAVLDKVESILSKEKVFSSFSNLKLQDLSPLQRQVMVEKHLLSPLMAKEYRYSSLFLRADEVVSIMVNEEDHLRIQCLLPGLQLQRCWEESSQWDDHLETNLDYDFEKNLGYLTSCPTNVGTGLRVSVMLHLPGLALIEQISRLLSAVSQVGLCVRGLYGEGSDIIGNLVQVSNQVTLGQGEEEILQNLYGVTRQLIEQEQKARQLLLNKGREKLEDRAGRALGILKHARLLSFKEMMQLLSDVRLGVDLGFFNGISRKALNELMVLARPGCLQLLKGAELNSYERDLERASQVRKYLKN